MIHRRPRSDSVADGAEPLRVGVGSGAQGALVGPDGLGDPTQCGVQGQRLAVPAVNHITEPHRSHAAPY